ncbi:MAG TPA: class I SAM-dependent methyltransferase [Acidimicrobiales bacterium]|nr:class I SAM-dependent methyltransferase [Acidimicrobiales bacterium]
MLTAQYERLGLRADDTLLDLGCGFGRHAFEAARRGAHVVALDAGEDEVKGVAGMFNAMTAAGELDESSQRASVVQGDALALPFTDACFDRVICSEVLEHIPDDLGAMRELTRVLRPGGTMAITVPRFFPELVNWALSDEYHNVPGGHIRIYRKGVLKERLTSTGLVYTGHHYAHGLHSPYWWLKCVVGTTNDEHPLVKTYHRLLVWDIMKKPRTTRYAEKILSPLMGKSIVLYLKKPS